MSFTDNSHLQTPTSLTDQTLVEGVTKDYIQSLINKKYAGIKLTENEKKIFKDHYDKTKIDNYEKKIQNNTISLSEVLDYEYLIFKKNPTNTDTFETWKTKTNIESIRKKYGIREPTSSTPTSSTPTSSTPTSSNKDLPFNKLVELAKGGKKSTRRTRKNRRQTKRKQGRNKNN
jgi:hypothetical protein